MNRSTALSKAVTRALTEAGFVNVTVAFEPGFLNSMTVVIAKGACPCGLGVSQFAHAFPNDRPPPPEHLYHRTLREAQKHIEQDKAEGRWQ